MQQPRLFVVELAEGICNNDVFQWQFFSKEAARQRQQCQLQTAPWEEVVAAPVIAPGGSCSLRQKLLQSDAALQKAAGGPLGPSCHDGVASSWKGTQFSGGLLPPCIFFMTVSRRAYALRLLMQRALPSGCKIVA